MHQYESILIISPEASEAKVGDINSRVSTIVEKFNGSVTKVEDWGIRKLGYIIKKNKRGHYLCVQFQAEPGVVKELERTLKQREDLLKQMTIRLNGEAQS